MGAAEAEGTNRCSNTQKRTGASCAALPPASKELTSPSSTSASPHSSQPGGWILCGRILGCTSWCWWEPVPLVLAPRPEPLWSTVLCGRSRTSRPPLRAVPPPLQRRRLALHKLIERQRIKARAEP